MIGFVTWGPLQKASCARERWEQSAELAVGSRRFCHTWIMASGLEIADWGPLGSAIRERRLFKELTLVDLADKAGLSQPFLSQVETGRARPSLMSLHRIADALDTTPQAFFGGPDDDAFTPILVRAREVQAVAVDADGEPSASTCHVLLGGEAPFHVLEFDGLPPEFLDYFEHDGFEAAYVIRGRVEIDIAGAISTLRAGDSISYSARLPHRLRAVGKGSVRVLLIETKVAMLQDRGPAQHAPARPRRKVAQARQRPNGTPGTQT